MEDKAHAIEWSIQLLYDLHWTVKKNGLDTGEGQYGLYDILASMVEQVKDSAIKIAELENEVARLQPSYIANQSVRPSKSAHITDQGLAAIS